MITTSAQPNTPTTLLLGSESSAYTAMPFGFTFALQSVRTGHAGARLLSAIELKEASLNEYNDTGQSRVEWCNRRV
jgi:hypothetical protein